jgi:hypothetical protein
VETLEDCGEIVAAQLLGRDPTRLGVRVATVGVWAAQNVAEPPAGELTIYDFIKR